MLISLAVCTELNYPVKTEYFICLVSHFSAWLSNEQTGTIVLSCCSAAWCLMYSVYVSMLLTPLSPICSAAWVRASSWWRVLLSSCSREAVTRARKHILTTNMQVRTARHDTQKAHPVIHIFHLNSSFDLISLLVRLLVQVMWRVWWVNVLRSLTL